MVRIAGVNLPNKRMEIALTYVYGIGRPRALDILEKCGIDINNRPDALTEDQVNAIRKEVGTFTVEGDLRRDVLMNIRRLKEIKCYRGTRHEKRLPARGQRTKRNSRTVRGNVRNTMGSGRAKVQKT